LTATRSLLYPIVFLLLVIAAAVGSRRALADCVIKPSVPPALPPGCVELVPDCICDDQGQNCRWIYHCIPNK
jgi:hypothetical protein